MLSKPMSRRAKEGTKNKFDGQAQWCGSIEYSPRRRAEAHQPPRRFGTADGHAVRDEFPHDCEGRRPEPLLRRPHGAMWSQPGFIPLALITVMADGLIK